MNRTQKQIIGWAIITIGAMLLVAVLASTEIPTHYGYQYFPDDILDFFKAILVSPYFFGCLVFFVVGLLTIKGGDSWRLGKAQKKIAGWALICIGALVSLGVILGGLSTPGYRMAPPTPENQAREGEDIVSYSNRVYPKNESGNRSIGEGKITAPKKTINDDYLVEILTSPIFYIGMILAICGVVVLVGNKREEGKPAA